jgi:hypothetical protein
MSTQAFRAGGGANWIDAGGTLEQLQALVESQPKINRAVVNAAEPLADGPLPLFPPPRDSAPYPIDSLGPTLSRAAKAIAAKVQCPDAMAAQSVLAAASLAACSHADVMMPFGQVRPLVLYLATVASSGDRKSTADNEALQPIYEREKNLREEYDAAIKAWKTEHAAWAAEKRKIEGAKIDFSERKSLLNSLGDEPPKPLSPFLVTGDLTLEGLIKNWPTCHPALGIFTTEGATFTAGHAMNADNQLKTAGLLSDVWDGKPVKRIRAEDGISILPGRRLATHIMIQPDAANSFLFSRALRDQGLLSRILVASPKSLAGTRFYKEATKDGRFYQRGFWPH